MEEGGRCLQETCEEDNAYTYLLTRRHSEPPDHWQRNEYNEEVTDDGDDTHDNAEEISGDSTLVRVIGHKPGDSRFRHTGNRGANDLGYTLGGDEGQAKCDHYSCLRVDDE